MGNKICFHGGKSFDAIGNDFKKLHKKYSIIRSDVTDAWYNPHPDIEKILTKDLNWFIKNSPPTLSEGLIHTISKVRNIPNENILVGGGSSDLMFQIFQHLIKKNDEVIILDPMYGEYAHILEHVVNAKIKRVKQTFESNFEINIDQIISAIGGKTKMIILVNPNNPTGQYLTKKSVGELLRKMPKDITLCIDETYIDYIGKAESMETEVAKYSNLIVIKSMSKVYALSGIRVGYVAANENVISDLNLFTPPWSVGLIGQLAGVIALENEKYYFKKIAKTKEINQHTFDQLLDIKGLIPIKTETNFILIKLPEHIKPEIICKKLEMKNIFIRNPESQSTQLNNFIRISIKDKHTTKKIITELKKQLLKFY